jgi:hypothetical protein
MPTATGTNNNGSNKTNIHKPPLPSTMSSSVDDDDSSYAGQNGGGVLGGGGGAYAASPAPNKNANTSNSNMNNVTSTGALHSAPGSGNDSNNKTIPTSSSSSWIQRLIGTMGKQMDRIFSSCADDPKGSVHRTWGISLIFVVFFFVLSIVESKLLHLLL